MELTEMSNKSFAFTCLNQVKEAGGFTETVLQILTSAASCRDWFRCSGFAVLMEVPAGCSEAELRKMCHFAGRRRYYQDRFETGGRTFVVSNHWYGPGRSMPDNRTPFLEWVRRIAA